MIHRPVRHCVKDLISIKLHRKTVFIPNRLPPKFTLALKYQKYGKVSYVYQHFRYESHLEARAEQYYENQCDKCMISEFCVRNKFVNIFSD